MSRHAHALRRLVLLLPAVVLLLSGELAGVAQAHAVLESSIPAQGVVQATAPAQVRLHFGEPVEISVGSLRVLDGNGKPVQAGAPVHPGGLGSDVAIPLKHLADGTYLVLWRVISADSHPVDGDFSFSVGHTGTLASASVSATNRTVAGAIGAARGLGYLGIAVFLGGFWFIRLCWPGGAVSAAGRRVITAGWLLAVAGTVGSLLLQGPYGAGLGVGDTFDHAVLSGDFGTRYGNAVVARLGLLAVLAAVAFLGLRTQRRVRVVTGLFTLVALGMLGTFAYTGHAGTGRQVPLAVVSDLAHVTSMSLWLGGLALLSLAVLPGATDEEARLVAGRFSRVALASVVALVVSGTYQSWRQAGILDSLTATYYGKLLLTKIGLVAAVLLVAAFSRRWVVRAHRVVVSAHLDVDEPELLRPARGTSAALRRSVALEAVLVVAVLGITSFLVSAPPAREAYRPSTAVNLQAGPVQLQLSIVPRGTRVLDIHVYTFAADGEVLPVQELDVSMNLPSQNTGPIGVPVADIDGSHFLATGVQLPYAGTWTMSFKVRTTAIDEFDAATRLVVR